MAVGCLIKKQSDGEIISVRSPYNGEESILYKDALNYFENQQEAEKVWLVASTESFKKEVYNPRVFSFKKKIAMSLDKMFPSIIQIQLLIDNKITKAELRTEIQQNQVKIVVKNQPIASLTYKPYKDGLEIVDFMQQNLPLYVNSRLINTDDLKLKYRALKTLLKTVETPLYFNENKFPDFQQILPIAKTTRGISELRTTPFDKNSEPYLYQVLEYIDRVNSQQISFTDKEKSELKIALSATNIADTNELKAKMEKAFFSKGIFSPTPQSLSILYSPNEAQTILNDINLQESLKQVYEKLSSLEEPILNDIYVDKRFLSYSEISLNILGKIKNDNPYLNERQALQELGGHKTVQDFETALENSDLNFIKQAYRNDPSIYNDYSNFNRISQFDVVQGELLPKKTNTKQLLEQTVKAPENTDLSDLIQYSFSISDTVWEENENSITTFLEEIENKASDIALDLTGLSTSYYSKTKQEIIDFLKSTSNFVQLNKTSNEFANEFDTFFGVTNVAVKVIKVNPEHRNRTLVFLQTNKKAVELFNSYGLLPIKQDTYIKVNNNTNLETLYENLYLNILERPQILPVEAYPMALDKDGNLNRNYINKPSNKQRVKSDIKKFIQQKQLDIVPSPNVSSEMLERMYIMAAYFNTKITNNLNISPPITSEVDIINNPIGNKDYLTSDYLSDLRIKQLKEKKKNSDAFLNFYSNIEFSERGISIINIDPISLENMRPYFDDNFLNYARINKFFNVSLQNQYDSYQDGNILRNYYMNFPYALEVFNKPYSKMSEQTVTSNENKDFIRIGEDVFEQVLSVGDNHIYTKLPTTDSIYKKYSNTTVPFEIDVEIEKYGFENKNQIQTELSNTYTAQESEEIDNLIECKR